MRLTEEQSRTLLAKHGAYVTEVCDKCGKLLGHVRFTLKDQPGEWCSRECRDGAAIVESHSRVKHGATRKGGRPPKYQTGRERRAVERQQDAIRHRAYRKRLSVTENPAVSDSFHVSTDADFRPLAIPIAGDRV